MVKVNGLDEYLLIEQSSNVFSEVKLLPRNPAFHVEYIYQQR